MRTRQYTISCKEVTGWAVTTLVEALGWSAALTRLGPERLVQLLVRAAAGMRSLSAMVQEAQAVPSWETVRQALLKYLPAQPQELLPATTRALHRRLPKGLRRRPQTMAIDLHLRPYYGSPHTPGVSRGKRKAGTKYFFAYASLLVIRRGQSFTVGLTAVAPGEKQTTVIARLLEQAQQAGLRVRRLLLDRAVFMGPRPSTGCSKSTYRSSCPWSNAARRAAPRRAVPVRKNFSCAAAGAGTATPGRRSAAASAGKRSRSA